MDPHRLVIEKTSGLFPLPEIEIEGKSYRAVKMTRPLWNKLRELEKRIRSGDVEAYYEQIQVMTEAPAEAVDFLDVQDVKRIIDFLMAHAMNPETAMDTMEKKASGPGPTGSEPSPATPPDISTPQPSKV
jgi:hypothetical protein